MAQFVEVSVNAHPRLPEGFFGRWKLATGRQETAVSQVFYSPDEGEEGQYRVEAVWSDGRRTPARQVWVEDSAAGVSALLVGGDLGLRLFQGDGEAGPGNGGLGDPGLWLAVDRIEEFVEAYLLLSE
jgi:hypothetical protein